MGKRKAGGFAYPSKRRRGNPRALAWDARDVFSAAKTLAALGSGAYGASTAWKRASGTRSLRGRRRGPRNRARARLRTGRYGAPRRRPKSIRSRLAKVERVQRAGEGVVHYHALTNGTLAETDTSHFTLFHDLSIWGSKSDFRVEVVNPDTPNSASPLKALPMWDAGTGAYISQDLTGAKATMQKVRIENMYLKRIYYNGNKFPVEVRVYKYCLKTDTDTNPLEAFEDGIESKGAGAFQYQQEYWSPSESPILKKLWRNVGTYRKVIPPGGTHVVRLRCAVKGVTYDESNLDGEEYVTSLHPVAILTRMRPAPGTSSGVTEAGVMIYGQATLGYEDHRYCTVRYNAGGPGFVDKVIEDDRENTFTTVFRPMTDRTDVNQTNIPLV